MSAVLSLFNLHTMSALAGLGMVGCGLWMVHPAACLIGVGGVVLFAAVGGQIGLFERRKGDE